MMLYMSNSRLSAYIAEQTKRGQTLDQIKATLLSLGWAAPEVESALAENTATPPPATPAPSPTPPPSQTISHLPPPPAAIPPQDEVPSHPPLVQPPISVPEIPIGETTPPPSTSEPQPVSSSAPAHDQILQQPQSTHSVMFSDDAEPSAFSKNLLRGVFIVLLIIIIGLGGYSALNSKKEKLPPVTTPDFSGAITEPELSLNTPASAVAGDQTYTYSHPDPKFSLTFPGTWKSEPAPSKQTLVFYVNPNPDTENGTTVRPSINVIAEPTSVASVSSEFAVLNQQELKGIYPDYESTQSKPVTLSDGTPAYLIGGVFSQSNLKVRNLQLLTIKNGQLFVVTATTFQSAWSQHETAFENSLLSFTFK